MHVGQEDVEKMGEQEAECGQCAGVIKDGLKLRGSIRIRQAIQPSWRRQIDDISKSTKGCLGM
jgi:hypothetical protein